MRFWLAVANDFNCQVLSNMGHPFYALSGCGSKLANHLEVGDLLILYRANRDSGFIGMFEATGNAVNSAVRLQGSARPFDVKIPWRPVTLCESIPVSVRPLVEQLGFIKNKKNYGMSFRSNLRQISEQDLRLIGALVRKNAREQGVADEAPL